MHNPIWCRVKIDCEIVIGVCIAGDGVIALAGVVVEEVVGVVLVGGVAFVGVFESCLDSYVNGFLCSAVAATKDRGTICQGVCVSSRFP